jgi:hypothetical protein
VLIGFSLFAVGALAQSPKPDAASDAERTTLKSTPSEAKPPYRYLLTRERAGDEPMCRNLRQLLNRADAQPTCGSDYAACRLDYIPPEGFAGLRLPDWQPLDPVKRMDVVRAVVHFGRGFGRGGNPNEKMFETLWGSEMWPNLEAGLQAGKLSLSVATIDIKSDGSLESVYRLDNRNCGVPPDLKSCNLYHVPLDPRTLEPVYSRVEWAGGVFEQPIFIDDRLIWLVWFSQPISMDPADRRVDAIGYLNVHHVAHDRGPYSTNVVCTFAILKRKS